MIFVAISLAIVTGVVQASFFEWAFHRYWLHRPWLPKDCFTTHTLIHHQLCKHDDTFHVTEEEQHEALTFAWWGGITIVAINTLPWALAAWAMSAAGATFPMTAFAITFAATMFVYYLGYEGFHFLMHKPTLPWIERLGFFKFIKNHHRLHHVYMGKNFNVVLPLADLMLGTLVLTDPLPRKITEPAARQVARRHSKWGQRLREEAEGRGTTSTARMPDHVTVPPEH